MEIRLTQTDFAKCVQCANERINYTKHNEFTTRYGKLPQFNRELMSFMGELAVANYFNVPYRFDIGYDAKRSDLVNGCEVRSSRHSNAELLVYPNDKPAPYVLTIVDVNNLSVDIIGWRHLIDCRLNKYSSDVNPPAWYKTHYVKLWAVPQTDLLNMTLLQKYLVGGAA